MKRLKKILKCSYIYLLLFLLVIVYSIVVTQNERSVYTGSESEFLIKVIDYEFDGNMLSISGMGKEQLQITYYMKSEEEKEKLQGIIKFGNYISVEGVLKEPKHSTIPNGFDYKDYLLKKGVFWVINPSKISLVRRADNVFYKIKNIAYEKADRFKNSTYIYAYILGNTDKLMSEVSNSYNVNGISHLFALSGLHVSIFALIIMKVLSIFKIGEVFKYLIAFLFLLLFSFITGFSPSILRATLLFFVLGLNKVFKLEIKSSNVLLLVFSILLFIRPYDLYSVGFQLSYIATYFLLISNYLFKNKNRLVTYFLVSLISFVSTLPIIVGMNNSVNLFSVINNIFFVPYVTYIVFPLTMLTFVVPFVSPVLDFFTYIMEEVSIFMSYFNAKVIVKDFPFFLVVIYYFVLIISLKVKNMKLVFINLLIVLMIRFSVFFDKSTYVYFLDVGQGDSAFIRTSNGSAILIDTGGVVSYKESWEVRVNEYSLCNDTLIPFYKSLGVLKIDYMFLTHGDADHAKEAICLSDNFEIDNVYINKDEVTSYEKVDGAVKFVQDYLVIDNVKIYSLNSKNYDNENDNSLVLLLEIDGYKFLFMGDASKGVEEEIIEKYNLEGVHVLKVGHHGSNTSTSEDFINEVKPVYSVISVGVNNRYGHPREEVLQTLKDSKVYRTDVDGSIMFMINKNKLSVKVYDGE